MHNLQNDGTMLWPPLKRIWYVVCNLQIYYRYLSEHTVEI